MELARTLLIEYIAYTPFNQSIKCNSHVSESYYKKINYNFIQTFYFHKQPAGFAYIIRYYLRKTNTYDSKVIFK